MLFTKKINFILIIVKHKIKYQKINLIQKTLRSRNINYLKKRMKNI